MCSSSSIALLLLLALSSLSAFADSVNVGSSTIYTVGSDVKCVGGGDYTKSGKSMKVSNLKSDHVMDTLRVFSTDNGATIASRKILTAQYPPFGTPFGPLPPYRNIPFGSGPPYHRPPPSNFPFDRDPPLRGFPVGSGLPLHRIEPPPPAKSIVDKVMERKIMGVTIPIGLIVLVVMACCRCTCRREEESAVSTDATSNKEQGGGPSNAEGKDSEVEMADKSNYKDEDVLLANDQLKTRAHDASD